MKQNNDIKWKKLAISMANNILADEVKWNWLSDLEFFKKKKKTRKQQQVTLYFAGPH